VRESAIDGITVGEGFFDEVDFDEPALKSIEVGTAVGVS
jgi:hypothetical protein